MTGESSPDVSLGTAAPVAGPPPARPGDHTGTDVLRLMRLLLTAVDCAGPDGLRLTNGSAVVALARTLVGDTDRDPHSSRSALMALRDLVWRVDSARALIEPWLDEKKRGELAVLLDTADIHAFLRQEP